MADILIRDVPDAVITALDKRASALGITRAELLRRDLQQSAQRSMVEVELQHLLQFADLAADLAEPSVMERAWQ